jgi:hypothetical protein
MSDHQEADLYQIQPRSVRFFERVPADKRHLVVALMDEIAREVGADAQLCGCGDFIEAALRLGARAVEFANSSEALEGFRADVTLHGDERTPQLPEGPDFFATGALVEPDRREFQGF